MIETQYVKSANVLALRRRRHPGVALVNQQTHTMHVLGAKEAQLWESWPADEIGRAADDSFLKQLATSGAVRRMSFEQIPTENGPADSAVFRLASNRIRWYAETGDLCVLFNSAAMPTNNPLLVLGPYGSLCWRGVVQGRTVLEMRRDALRTFGYDEVERFLARLHRLGFVAGDAAATLRAFGDEQIVKEFTAPDVQFQMIQSALPWYCLWELSHTCDLRCKICYQPDFKAPGPSALRARDIAQHLMDSGLFFVCLLGGEPLLRADLEDIVAQLREGGVFVKIISNGQRLTRERALALQRADLNQIEISFDGLASHTHDASRGAGTFDAAVLAVRLARAAAIPRVAIVWTVHSGNEGELARLPEFLDSIAVHECYLSLFKKTGLNGSHALWTPLSGNALKDFRQRVNVCRRDNPRLTVVLLPSCSCGRTSIVIGANGDVRPCSFSPWSAGNIGQSSLLDIWRTMEAELPDSGPVGYCQSGTESARTQTLPDPARRGYSR